MPAACTCQTCQCVFYIPPSRAARHGGKYCSKVCQLAAAPPISRICQRCHVSFFAKPSIVQRGDARYCSRACAYQARTLPGIVNICLYCRLPFRFMPVSQHSGKYCSWLCYNAQREAEPLQERFCSFCGTLFVVDITTIRRGHGKFCSIPCAMIAKFSKAEIETRFWQRVARCDHPLPCTMCCWLWQGTRQNHGYGTMTLERKCLLAHRVSWAWAHEEDPLDLDPSLLVRHLCHTPLCVNDAHLVSGTQLDNMRDSALDARIPRGEQHVHAKLTIAQVKDIRQLRTDGMTHDAIARLFAMSRRAIGQICARKSWAHVP